jgi:uracil permease
MKNNLNVQINEKPKTWLLWVILSLQHIFAMFGSTVLVPTLTGMDPAVAIFTSGLGTLIYIFVTKKKVPMYLGSSFAYISAITLGLKTEGYGFVASGIFVVGLLHIFFGVIIKYLGTQWINKLLPPVVIGPMIMIIGLSMAQTAVSNAGLSADNFNLTSIFIATMTLLVSALVSIRGKGYFKIIPIIIGIVAGYILALTLNQVDTSLFSNIPLINVPQFQIPLVTYQFDFNSVLMFAPISLVTLAEHIGETSVIGSITQKDFFTDPGLKRTLVGDGLATSVAGLLGGPATTTYGENNGVIALTKVASIYVMMLAAIMAMALSFFVPLNAFIKSIPSPVMGGVSIILFGIIASNGVKILIKENVDYNSSRNLIIMASMLIIGLGKATIQLSSTLEITGMALAALIGIVLNVVLPQEK